MTTVTEAVQARYSTRAFLDKPVPGELVRKLLELASRAPSGGNLQPWHVYALTGEPLAQLKTTVLDKVARDEREQGEYEIFPPNLWEPLNGRRAAAGAQRFAVLGLGRDANAQAQIQHMNFTFFGAPVGLFFAIDRRLGPPQWSDLGMYMQTLMLLAIEHGLDTCSQEIWSLWPRTVAQAVGMPDEQMLFAGMALGYADKSAPVNGLRTARVPVEEFATLLGFD